MKLSKAQMMFVGGGLIVLILVGTLVFRGRSSSQKNTSSTEPTEAVIPTVDTSVQVSLTSSSGGKEVALNIKGIPLGTQTIDYELSYQTKQQGLQGVIGTITLTNESEYQKSITLGTCSSGKCVYHEVVGKIKLSLKFTGSYGDKIFEKEYGLEGGVL